MLEDKKKWDSLLVSKNKFQSTNIPLKIKLFILSTIHILSVTSYTICGLVLVKKTFPNDPFERQIEAPPNAVAYLVNCHDNTIFKSFMHWIRNGPIVDRNITKAQIFRKKLQIKAFNMKITLAVPLVFCHNKKRGKEIVNAFLFKTIPTQGDVNLQRAYENK